MNNPLPLSSCFVITHWGQYEIPTLVLLEGNVFCLLNMNRNLNFVICLQILNTKLPYSPIFKVFVGPIPPFRAGIGKGIPNYRRTLDTGNRVRGMSLGVIHKHTEKREHLDHQNRLQGTSLKLRLQTSIPQLFS